MASELAWLGKSVAYLMRNGFNSTIHALHKKHNHIPFNQDFQARIKKKNPDSRFLHCFLLILFPKEAT